MSYDYRMVYTKMWREDSWYSDLPPDGKLFWLYLLTNSSANASGVYQLRAGIAAFEVGLPVERVEQLLADFARAGKLRREGDTLWVVKMREYQTRGSRSPKLLTSIHANLRAVSDCRLKYEYAETYGDTLEDLLQNPLNAERLKAEAEAAPANGSGEQANPQRDPFTFALDYLNKREGVNGKPYNPVAMLAYLFGVRFGEAYKPNLPRLGKIAKSLGDDHIALAKLIWSSPVPEGDPHNYLTRAAQKSGARPRGGNGSSLAESFVTTDDDSDAHWRAYMAGKGAEAGDGG